MSGKLRQKKNPLEKSRGLGSQYQVLTRLAERTGLEPAISGVTGRHSNRLNYRSGADAVWWAKQGSNL